MAALSETELADFILSFVAGRSRPTLFAGAGVGARAGMPTWATYLAGLATIANQYQPLAAQLISDRMKNGQYLAAATTYKSCVEIPVGERFRHLAAPFMAPPDPAKLHALVSLPFVAILTTNYDRSLLDAYAAVHRKAPATVELGDLSMKGAVFSTTPFIARMHGRAEMSETIVLDEADFARVSSDPYYIDLLKHALLMSSCLFVGFSFLDPAINNILRLIEQRFSPNLPRLHAAILPSDADSTLVGALAKYNIETVQYDATGGHGVLWQAITRSARSHAKRLDGPRLGPSTHSPFAIAQKFLATAYARAKLGGEIIPLREMVLDGVVTQLLLGAASAGLAEQDVALELARLLGFTIDETRRVASEGLQRLRQKGVIETLATGRIVLAKGIGDYLNEDMATLTQGVVDRILLREGRQLKAEAANVVRQCLEMTIATRSWDLGAHYAGSDRITEPPEVLATIETAIIEAAPGLTTVDRKAMSLAINDLLQHPDDTESGILAELGRLAFGLQVVINAPAANILHEAILPDAIYLDANVVMPAIVDGHPYHPVYVDAISRLTSATRSMGRTVAVRVGSPFLNEIISHRALALQEVAQLRLEDPGELERYMLIYGADNTNVYIAAYASWVGRLRQKLSFDEFMGRHANYSDERALATHLAGLGMQVVDLHVGVPDFGAIYPTVRSALYDSYENDQTSTYDRKPQILIDHEASQLTRLLIDLRSRIRALFVTADLRLRRLSTGPTLGECSEAMISHRNLIQLVDLLIGLRSDARSLSRLLWSRPQTNEQLILRDYLIARALRSFDEAQIMSLPEVLEKTLNEASVSAKEEGISLFPGGSVGSKANTAKFLDRVEDRYYRYMSEAIEKRKATE